MENGERFLDKKYQDFRSSDAVKHEQERRKIATENGIENEEPSKKPTEQIKNFLEVISRTHSHHEDPRVLERIKRAYHKKYVIEPQHIPESAFLLEQRIARNLGHGDIEITDEFKERKTQEIITNQTQSLDKWIDYLTSPDATYPTWGKYWAFRSVVGMGKFEKAELEENGMKKEKAIFKPRTKDTVASFPMLNARALAETIGVMSEKLERASVPKKDRTPVVNKINKLSDTEFQQLLSTEDFAKIYAQFLLEMPEYSNEGLQETRGEWVKYDQGSDPTSLVMSMEGYPLEWCTANRDTAKEQLEGGDFYVYYSLNQEGEAKIPRIAIRMEEDRIAEVRGIAADQNLDPYIGDVVKEKMNEFPDGARYEKKAGDMKRLTEIENKIKQDQQLSKDELTFLYEMDSRIDGFGYEEDPRIQELQESRRQKYELADMLTILECTQSEIAVSLDRIDESTKAYIGPLEPGVFEKIQQYNIEHIFTKFPEQKIHRQKLVIGGKTATELVEEMKEQRISISDLAKSMLKSIHFSTAQTKEEINLVRLKVKDLGLKESNDRNFAMIVSAAKKLGLSLCPAEVGPQLRLAYKDQPLADTALVGMVQMHDYRGYLSVFSLENYGEDLLLGSMRAKANDLFGSDMDFIFSIGKPKS